MKISILIPTLDNPEYLKCVVDSIAKHTTVEHEVLIHQNTAENNIGLAAAINQLGRQAKGEYICYLNDDMYVAPGWDKGFLNAVDPKIRYQYITAPMFEPQYTNPCMNAPMDYGRTPATFREEDFLREWKTKRRITKDIVSPWCPIFVTKSLWDEVGGYSEEYFPCYGTDPDFAAKIYFAALKKGADYEFRGAADVGVYHFQAVTTDRLSNAQYYREVAKQIFISKWGMDHSTFYKECLQIGKEHADKLKKYWADAHIRKNQNLLTGTTSSTELYDLQIEDRVVPGANILEIGVGTGEGIRDLASRASVTVSVVDIVPEAFDRIKDLPVSTYLADSLDLLPSSYFDLALSYNVACHQSDSSLREQIIHVVRSLKPSGTFALLVTGGQGKFPLDCTWDCTIELDNLRAGSKRRSIEEMEKIVTGTGGKILCSGPSRASSSHKQGGFLYNYYVHIVKEEYNEF